MFCMCDISVSFKFCNQLLRPTVRGLDRDRDIGSANGEQQWQGAGPDHPAFPTFQTCCWNVVYFVCRRFLKAGNGRICFFFSFWEEFWCPLLCFKTLAGPGPVVNSHWHMRMAASICMANSLKIMLPISWHFHLQPLVPEVCPNAAFKIQKFMILPTNFSDPCFQQPRGYGSGPFQSQALRWF